MYVPLDSKPQVTTGNIKKQRTRKAALVGGTVVAVSLLGFAGYGFYRQYQQPSCTGADCKPAPITPTQEPTPTPTPTPNLTPSALDGTLVPLEKATLRPLAVIVENHPDARPQSGLSAANVVYEAIAEGGITRFMAVFRDPTQSVRVGPVRSARTYFVDYAQELQAFFAHVGGNIDALDQIKADGILDLDQFSVGSAAYRRDTSRKVALEHTMYSSTDGLWKYAVERKGWPQNAGLSPLTYAEERPLPDRPASQTVSIQFSDPKYAVRWEYDPASNSYARRMANAPHTDANTGTQISAKTVIVQTVTRRSMVTRINEHGWVFETRGSGPVTVATNGTITSGTWRKEGNGRTKFFDANGNEISLARGTMWIEVVHPDTKTAY